MEKVLSVLTNIDTFLYYPILIILLPLAAIWFTIRTRFVQVRMFGEACHAIMEKPAEEGSLSSFQALMVSTASRVGTGNIVGVSTAICLGGPGAVLWMQILAILDASTAFIETTLAQIYKRKNRETGEYYGGPAYYIENALHSKIVAGLFVFFLILPYGVGFQLLCSYNLQTTFQAYSFYDAGITPWIVGAVLAVLVAICLFGGGKRIAHVSSLLVPIMGVMYVISSLVVIFAHVTYIPTMVVMIFQDAFNFKAIGAGLAGSCMVYGMKRGLYSNEAGVGSAPNAAASADVSHPVKQGLVAMISVYIDTLLLCTATALMCLSSKIAPTKALSGAPYVQASLSSVFGKFGPIFITVSMILFAFTTLIGNLFYVDTAVSYLNGKKEPGKKAMNVIHILCIIVIFLGAVTPMDAAWAAADISMGGMAIINVPCCLILGSRALRALKDYEQQKKAGKDPKFYAASIHLNEAELDCWKAEEE